MSSEDDSGGTASSSGPQSTSTPNRRNEDEEQDHQISFSSYQLFVFASNYVAYCIMLYNRKSFTFALPHIMMDHYFSGYEVGVILGAQTFTYTITRFFCSWATDHYSPKYMLSGGLFFSGIVILSLSDQTDWVNIVMLTAANGAAQGMGWPAVTKMIRAWFPPTQFGLWYALISTVSNMVSTMGPSVAQVFSVSHGWKSALQLPAMMAIGCSALVPFFAFDKPSDVGYEDQTTLTATVEGHWSDLAGSDFMALLASTLCLMFVVKTCCMDWGPTYLIKERGISPYLSSGYIVSMEIGGLFGSIALGAFTDFFIRRRYFSGTGQSPRMSVVEFCVAGSCLVINLFLFSIDPESSRTYLTALGFCMGFCMYGALSLLGAVTVEIAPIHVTGAAHAIVGAASNFGSVLAGAPMEYIANVWSWYTVFVAINITCTFVFFLLVIGKDIKASFISKNRSGPAKLRVR